MKKNISCNRREFLKISAAGAVAVPFANLLLSGTAHAEDLPHVEESDPMAQGLKYVHDASASARPDAAQHCANCQLFTGAEGAEWGPCAIFVGKSVNANGWCSSWVAKAG
jgi:hypothetical protein